jgi:hypothetical protein
MKMKRTTIALTMLFVVTGVQPGIAQTVYQLPFASSDNSIELTVANSSTQPLSGVAVEVTGLPTWLKFTAVRQSVNLLKAEQEHPVFFTFSVDKSAPIKKEQTIIFAISSSTGERWTKEIKVTVSAPEHFELFQNYPNPFNPTTTVGYQLPGDSRVSLKVFNILGQEVTTLVDAQQLAGYHEERWEAGGFASGMYVYQLSLTDESGSRQVTRKVMMLVR